MANLPVLDEKSLERINAIERVRGEVVETDNNKEEDIKYLNEEELETLFAYLKENNPFYYMLCLLLFETGCRVTEARKLKFKDINYKENTIKLRNLKQKKISYKTLPISDNLKFYLRNWEADRNFTKTDYVLAKRPNKEAITIQAIDELLRKTFNKIFGEEYNDKAHAHTFRHSRAIFNLNHGMDIAKLKLFLGHSSYRNTFIYLKYANADLFDTVHKINGEMKF